MDCRLRFCPGVRVHKGITIVLSLFRNHWLAVVYHVWSFVAALGNRYTRTEPRLRVDMDQYRGLFFRDSLLRS